MTTNLHRRHPRALRIAAAAVLVLGGAAGMADVPREAAEFPGFRPDSPRAAAFVAALDSATIVVHPTMLRRARRTAHSFDSRSRAVALLGSAGIDAVPSNVRVERGRLIARSQWDTFQSELQQVAAAVKGRNPAAQYHLVLEFLLPVSDGEIFGIECYVVDQQGENAFSFLLNSHHKIFVDAQLVARDSSEAARTEMHARATEAAIAALRAQIALQREKAGRAAARSAALAAGDYQAVVFDDFESAVAATADAHGGALGFIALSDGRSSLEAATTVEYPLLPDAARGTHALRLDMDVDDWVAFAHYFYFQDAETARWSPYDWRAFDGIAFWLYGQNRGAGIFVDILDNRNPGSTSDDAERFTFTLTDDFAGWRRVAIPFDDFVRKEVGNGAPNDGLGLSSVHGWAIGAANTAGPVTYFVDDFSLWHVRVGVHEFAGTAAAVDYPVNELPMYGLREKTAEQQRADDEYIRYMTRGGRSREAAAETAAKNAWDVFYRGDKATAIKRFNQAWLLDPGNQLALWGFAVTCVDRGQLQEAARYYRLAIDSGPPNPGLERDYRLTLRQFEKLGTEVPESPDR